MIRNSELLSGFTDPEIEIIAQVARYHRRGEPSLKHAPFAALDEHDQQRVRWLAAILRVAIGLDRSHAGAVATVGVDDAVGGGDDAASMMITVVPNGDADISLEIYSARERVGLLEQMLEQAVQVR